MTNLVDVKDARFGRKVLTACCTALALPALALAGEPVAQIEKIDLNGPDPIEINQNVSTQYQFSIRVNCDFDELGTVTDIVPAEFDVTALAPSCGTATWTQDISGKGKSRKLAPDLISWNLAGDSDTTDPCDCSLIEAAVLNVTMVTDGNPGRRKGQQPTSVFEPTSCGPLAINEGAELFDLAGVLVATSNSLGVATCIDDSVIEECVDGDDDLWSVSCGDCDDTDSAVFPGAVPVCDGSADPAVEALEDDNCDGAADFPDLGSECETGNLGICAAGTELCTQDGTGSECVQDEQAGSEICDNGLDDDCDGATDINDIDCTV